MARPRKAERREQQLNIKITPSEHAWVRQRASAADMTPTEFGRAQLLTDRPVRRKSPENTHHLDPLFLSQLSRIGNNLNQIARRCHLLNAPPPPALEPLLGLIRDIIRRALPHGS